MPRLFVVFCLIIVGFFSGLIISCKQKRSEPEHPGTSQDTSHTHASSSTHPVHWGYEGEAGPSYWGSLSPVYALCAEGKGQSPVNIISSKLSGKSSWKVDYKKTSLKITHNEHITDILDNGHTIQVSVEEGNTLTVNQKLYALKQFHFHCPSEHTLDGKHLPMEMHMVHQSEDGQLAVLGIFFKEGNISNENLAKIIANLPGAKGESKHITDQDLDLNLNLPKDIYAYHYIGSLTTPPCSENVQWLVFRDLLSCTTDQVKALSARISPNNRPTQALHERKVELIDLHEQ